MMLRGHFKDEDAVEKWRDVVYNFVAKDSNPHFDELYVFFEKTRHMPDASYANFTRRLRSNYPGFFTWQKPQKEWWVTHETIEGPELDVLLPYWMMRYEMEIQTDG